MAAVAHVLCSRLGCVHAECRNPGNGQNGRSAFQQKQSFRYVAVGSRWASFTSRKNVVIRLSVACAQLNRNGVLNRKVKKHKNMWRFSAQGLHPQAAALIPQAAKNLKGGKDSDKIAIKARRLSGLSGKLHHGHTVEVEKARPVIHVSEQVEDSIKKPPKKKKYTPVEQLRFDFEVCSKNGDLENAIDLYEKTLAEGHPKLIQYHYNIVLYLCSSAALGVLEPKNPTKNHVAEPEQDDSPKGSEDSEQKSSFSEEEDIGGSMSGLVGKNMAGLTKDEMKFAEEKGFQIYQKMCHEGVPRNEATFTAVARLAVAREDGDLAFQMIKEMAASGVAPRLRSYGPALYTYYRKKDIERAFEVDAHMLQSGILPEESELQVLLRLSVEAGQQERVYSLLHRLRATLRDLLPSTVDIIERWFNSTPAEHVKAQSGSMPTMEELRSAMVSKGGGWHGLGWQGEGKWKVERTNINKKGFCECCGEQLVTIDIDPQETEKFQGSLVALACERAHCGKNFKHFQDWLDQHGPFDYVVDAANISLHNQNFQGAGLNFFQLHAVVSEVQRMSGKLPLIILHHKRANEVRGRTPMAQRQLNEWSKYGAFYTTPTGFNDDWFWLYAAVKNKCLIVTNDEMRDHLFQLLGKDFFPKWKERHQVRFSLNGHCVNFHMPPPYSIIIQESVTGSWHVPKSGGDDVLSPREWLCVTRGLGMCVRHNLSESKRSLIGETTGKE